MTLALTQWLLDLRDVCFPGRCAVCQSAVAGGGRFCQGCDHQLLALEDRPQCLDCGAPVAVENSPCQRCGGRGYRLFDSVVRLAVFDDPLKRLIHRLKFYHGWSVGELLAERAMAVPRVRDLLENTDFLIPVPLHPWRQITRGFNQADVLARRLGRLSRRPVRSAAIRLRATAAQTLQTSRVARMKNARDAFALLNPRGLLNQRVTIVDDVMTTGATLKALAKVLAEAKPARINVLTLAIADPKGHGFEAT